MKNVCLCYWYLCTCYRPQRSCGQGYVCTRVCDSVNTPGRRLLSRTVRILLECILVYYTIIIHCWPTTLTLIFCTDMCIKTWILQPLTMSCRSQVLLKSNLCILMNSIVTSHQLFLSFLSNIRHDTLDSDKFITALTKHTLHLLVAHKNRVEFELYCCI